MNPGILMVNVGATAELTPKLRAIANANYIRFMETAPLEILLKQPDIRNDVGVDVSLGVEYRPLLNNNIIVQGLRRGVPADRRLHRHLRAADALSSWHRNRVDLLRSGGAMSSRALCRALLLAIVLLCGAIVAEVDAADNESPSAAAADGVAPAATADETTGVAPAATAAGETTGAELGEVPADTAPPLLRQTQAEADAKSTGCLSCHAGIEPMHASEQVKLGCTDCHGGDAAIGAASAQRGTPEYDQARARGARRCRSIPRSGPTRTTRPHQLREPGAQLHAAEPGVAGVHPLHEPGRPARRRRDLRLVSHQRGASRSSAA